MSPRSAAGIRRGVQHRFTTPVAATAPPVAPDVIAREPIQFVHPKQLGVITNIEPLPPTVQLASVTVEDLDQLWDWARSDREGVSSFLSASYANSQAFFNRMGTILADEQKGSAYLRSVRDGDALIGFVMLAPIINNCATVHLYLKDWITDALSNVIELLPRSIQLMWIAPTPDFAAKFTTHGFTSQIVLTRPASKPDESRE